MPTEIPNIYEKLASLLSTEHFRSSAEVIDAFAERYPSDSQHLIDRFGDRLNRPGEGARKHFYAASTYIADRLATMARMGQVELKHTTDFDRTRWVHNKRMGTWRLKATVASTGDANGAIRAFTVKLPESEYEKLVMIADRRGRALSTTAAELLVAAVRIGA